MNAIKSCLVVAAIVTVWSLLAAGARGQDPSYRWGRLANPGFEGARIRTTLFFAGQAKDGSNPYGCPAAPPANTVLYTVSPADQRHLQWSTSSSNREFAVTSMVKSGINVVSLSTWGEDFLSCNESWALWAPMQTSPQAQDELFTAVGDKPIFIMPFIESRANWTFYNEFPRWTDGRVAPGTVSQIVHLVRKYLQDNRHPEWASRWAQVYDSTGQPRFAVVIIHAASNRLSAGAHAEYAAGFDLVAEEVRKTTGVRVGFFIDALPPKSNAPGNFKPSPGDTGPFLRTTRSILGIQCFIPEIWLPASSSTETRIRWKANFSRGWEATGIPFLMDVSPGYDAHIVFPGSAYYGYTARWREALTGMVAAYGCDGLAYNSFNGYTEGMTAVSLEPADGGDIASTWARSLTALRPACSRFRRGDANADAAIDISDAIAVLGYLFLGHPEELGCMKSADTDDSGVLDISDGVYLLSYLFMGSRPPGEPFIDCGFDASQDDLPCDAFAPCP